MASKQYKMNELRSLSDEELREISLQKNKKGNYTTNANNAMKVRNERAEDSAFRGIPNRTTFAATLFRESGKYD